MSTSIGKETLLFRPRQHGCLGAKNCRQGALNMSCKIYKLTYVKRNI